MVKAEIPDVSEKGSSVKLFPSLYHVKLHLMHPELSTPVRYQN